MNAHVLKLFLPTLWFSHATYGREILTGRDL